MVTLFLNIVDLLSFKKKLEKQEV